MNSVLTESLQILLTVDTPAVNAPTIILPFPLAVKSSDKLTIDGLKAVIGSDMESQQTMSGITYNNSAGGFAGGTLSWDGKLNGYKLSKKLKKDDAFVVTNESTGVVQFTVGTPASHPTSGVADAIISYSGKWTIVSPIQTKLKVN